MDVLCLLPDPMLRRVQIAIGAEHTVITTDDFPAFERMLRRRPVHVAVVDTEIVGAGALPLLRAAVVRHPSVAFVAYLTVSPDGMRMVVELASRGVRHIVLKDYDDDAGRLRTRLESLPADAMSAQMITALAPLLEAVPAPIVAAIEQLFREPHTVLDVEDFVRLAGLPRRSFDRALERAGFAPARQLVRSARVVRVYSYLRESRQSPEEIAERLGYASAQQCWRHVKLVTGFGFVALRRQLEPRAFIEQVAARLRRANVGDTSDHDDTYDVSTDAGHSGSPGRGAVGN